MRVTTLSQAERHGEAQRSTPVPLLSESAVPHIMPPVFRTGDLIALFLLNVFWVTNITPVAAGGPAGFLYWFICGGAFFIPCSLVMTQLARMFPHEGSILTWTAHALGLRWSFFVGLCAWLPGILSIVNAAAACISWIQALNAQWLTQPWQQGAAILLVLIFTGVLACQRTSVVQYVLNIAAGAMGLSTALIVLAAVVWLTSGHHAATTFANTSSWAITPSNFALLGSATLALLGSDMPLALAGEVVPRHQRRVFARHLTWGTIFTLAGYLLFTFAVLVVQGAGVAANTVNPMVLLIGTVDQVFGKAVGNAMALCLGFYFLMIPVALHLCFSRLLLVASIDRHISIWFASLNRQRVPLHAIVSQVTITLGAAVLIYFLVPSISFLGKPADLSSIAYNIIGASLLLVWAVSFLFPFLDVVLLYLKDRPRFEEAHLLPLPVLFPVLVACCITGIGLCVLTIGFTLSNSFIPTLIPNTSWWYIIGGSALGGLILFATFSVLTSSAPQQYITLATTFVGSWLGMTLVVFVLTSNFASAFAMHQAMVRYCYDLGRAGIFPHLFGRTHPRWKSPHIASIGQSLFSLLLIGFLGLIIQHTNKDGSSRYALGIADGRYWQQTNGTVSFGWLASIVTMCILVVYVLTNLAAPFFARRRGELRLLPHILAPVGSIALLLLPLASYIGPALPGSIGAAFTRLGFAPTPFPSNILPLFVLLWLVLGGIYAAFLKRRHPEPARASLLNGSTHQAMRF